PTLHSIARVIRDATGNVKEDIVQADQGDGVTSRSLQIAWDSLDQTFPARITHPAVQCRRIESHGAKPPSCHDLAAQVEDIYFHAGLGELAARIDANGLLTTVQFDRFGRMRLIDNPSSDDISIDYALSPDGLMTVTSTRGSGGVSREF